MEAPVATLVTVRVDGQLFGLPIGRVHDVFAPPALTPVPLAPPDVAGLLNLRGRVVTAIDLRARLGLPPGDAEARRLAVGVEDGSDLYGLLVDGVGDVVEVDGSTSELAAIGLAPAWLALATGLFRADGELLVGLDVDALLQTGAAAPGKPPDPKGRTP